MLLSLIVVSLFTGLVFSDLLGAHPKVNAHSELERPSPLQLFPWSDLAPRFANHPSPVKALRAHWMNGHTMGKKQKLRIKATVVPLIEPEAAGTLIALGAAHVRSNE